MSRVNYSGSLGAYSLGRYYSVVEMNYAALEIELGHPMISHAEKFAPILPHVLDMHESVAELCGVGHSL